MKAAYGFNSLKDVGQYLRKIAENERYKVAQKGKTHDAIRTRGEADGLERAARIIEGTSITIGAEKR